VVTSSQQDRGIGAVAALGERARRALYEYVASQPEPVGREEAAQAVGIGRPLAAFHLDRLVQRGLLEATYRRLGARTGPGAGRTSKLYRRAPVDLSVSLPPRDYELAARVMLEALDRLPGEAGRAALERSARALGESLGREAARRAGPGPAPALLEAAAGVLEERGFEPFVDPEGVLRLRNCAFRSLAADRPELVCAMNLALVEGLLAGLGGRGDGVGVRAALEPGAGTCCVALRGRNGGGGDQPGGGGAPPPGGQVT
jgi:predicted ArsR family transcriptional regulator